MYLFSLSKKQRINRNIETYTFKLFCKKETRCKHCHERDSPICFCMRSMVSRCIFRCLRTATAIAMTPTANAQLSKIQKFLSSFQVDLQLKI